MLRMSEEERRRTETVELEKAQLVEELRVLRVRAEEGLGQEVSRLEGEVAARGASIQVGGGGEFD